MDKVIMTGQLKCGDNAPGCLFTVRQCGERKYRVILISPYSGEIVVEPAEPLESHEVFIWLEDHKDW